MKKRFKLLEKGGRIFLLHWTTDGVLFGPDWERIATFSSDIANMDRCKEIIRLMNECDRHTERSEDDRK